MQDACSTRGCPSVPRPMTPTPPMPGRLPANLSEAIDVLEADEKLTQAMGARFVPCYAALKRAEIARFERTVTDWEQREYFDLY